MGLWPHTAAPCQIEMGRVLRSTWEGWGVLCAQQVLHFIFFHREKKHILKSIDVRKQLTGKSSSVVEEALLLFFLTNRKKKKSWALRVETQSLFKIALPVEKQVERWPLRDPRISALQQPRELGGEQEAARSPPAPNQGFSQGFYCHSKFILKNKYIIIIKNPIFR